MRRRSTYKPRWRTPIPVENSGVEPRLARRRYSAELIAATREVWQPHYLRPLTDEDVREIIENMVAFMGVMAKFRGGKGDGSI